MNAEVVCVDSSGKVVSTACKQLAHDYPGMLHLAFSVFLLDERGRLVLQRRSGHKRLWPLFWSNACCSHPAPGEAARDAVCRRVQEELGATANDLRKVTSFEYQAPFPGLGMERELCEVWLGNVRSDTLHPDAREVDAVAFLTPAQLTQGLASTPGLFTPWCSIEWPLLSGALQPNRG
jgi:isopentenyl-diphosphate delta-isomerase